MLHSSLLPEQQKALVVQGWEEKPSSCMFKMKHADSVQESQQKCLLVPRQEQLP